VVPVGDVFFYVEETHPEIDLYEPDNHHPSKAGAYLYGLVLYSHLFGKTNLPAALADKTLDATVTAAVSQQLRDSLDDWYKSASAQPEYGLETPDSSVDVVQYLFQQNRLPEAEGILLRRLSAIDRLNGKAPNWQRGETEQALAAVLYKEGRRPESRHYLENACANYEAVEGKDSKASLQIRKYLHDTLAR
jgi:hypothetical protein